MKIHTDYGYKPELNTNVITEKEMYNTVSDTLKTTANILKRSLGPYGSTSIIQDKLNVNHQITKDGYTILNKIKYDNHISSTILDFVKKISRNLVKEVGDGSTSAVVISDSLYHSLLDFQGILDDIYGTKNTMLISTDCVKKEKVPTKDIIGVLNSFQEQIENLVKLEATMINEDNFSEIVTKIASVSNNNDKKLGELIAEVYSHIGGNGFISLEESVTTEDSYEITDGIEIYRGQLSDIFSNQPDKVTCEFNSSLILMCNEALEENNLEELQDLIGQALQLQKPLLILAKGFSNEVRQFLTINKHNNRQLDITAVDYAIANRHHGESFEDLAAYVGATIYNPTAVDQTLTFSSLGMAEKIVTDDRSTRIIKGKSDTKRVQDRLTVIEQELEALKEKEKYVDVEEERYLLYKRKANLEGKIATIKVGGETSIEKETRKFLLEDAVFACKSAINNGYVVGGNLIIPYVIEKNFETIVNNTIAVENILVSVSKENVKDTVSRLLNTVLIAFKESYLSVLNNRILDGTNNSKIVDKCTSEGLILNLKTNEYETFKDSSIINSVETDIQIMKATFSLIGLISTSNQFISVQSF